MTSAGKTTTTTEGRNLILERVIAAPREKVFKAWTDPELMKQWFAPKPWTTPRVETDVHAGGASLVVMRGPDGQEISCPGVYLEVVPNEKLVFTDAFTGAWELANRPFMTVVITFDDIGGGRTKYKAVAKHWNDASREEHEKMGFHQGRSQCAEQLAALVEH
jgi:uncharacterized protein YndB with AHSA1/START domain